MLLRLPATQLMPVPISVHASGESTKATEATQQPRPKHTPHNRFSLSIILPLLLGAHPLAGWQ
jgi:hypothetical protein